MRVVLQSISWFALLALIVPPTVFLFDGMAIQPMKWIMLAATLVWFVITPLWMGKAEPSNTEQAGQPDGT
jgi:hypothetical protein